MQTVIVNKFIIGAMALFVMLGMNNLLFKSGNIDVRIYRHDNNQFFGELIIKDKKLPLIVNVDGDNDSNNSEKTYNENKNYHEDKEYTEYKESNDKREINENKQYDENKQYNEQKDHNINNNSNKKEEIINKNEDYSNKKEEKFNENIKITDDKTPGSIDIIIKNGDIEVNINRDIGSREMSEIDKEICRKSIDAVVDFIQNIKGNSKSNIKNNVVEKVKGFKDYISRKKEGRWFKW